MNVPEGFPRFKSSQQCPHSDRTNDGTVCSHCRDNKQTKSSGSPMRRVPIRKRAKASKGLREGRLRERTKAFDEERQKALDNSDGLCALKVHPQCTRIAQGAHHVKSRSRGGSDYAVNLLAACNLCNTWVEDNPDEAHKQGFAKHFWEAEG